MFVRSIKASDNSPVAIAVKHIVKVEQSKMPGKTHVYLSTGTRETPDVVTINCKFDDIWEVLKIQDVLGSV